MRGRRGEGRNKEIAGSNPTPALLSRRSQDVQGVKVTRCTRCNTPITSIRGGEGRGECGATGALEGDDKII
jgi:hypothetical protein